MSAATVADVRDGTIVGLLALAGYLERTNDHVESFASRWATDLARNLYKSEHGEIELDANGNLTGRYVELELESDKIVVDYLELALQYVPMIRQGMALLQRLPPCRDNTSREASESSHAGLAERDAVPGVAASWSPSADPAHRKEPRRRFIASCGGSSKVSSSSSEAEAVSVTSVVVAGAWYRCQAHNSRSASRSCTRAGMPGTRRSSSRPPSRSKTDPPNLASRKAAKLAHKASSPISTKTTVGSPP